MFHRHNAFLALLIAVTVFHPSLFAANKGEIININQNYRIAFTDLGSTSLKQGDIVRVLLGGNEFVYLEVLESSVILSKLGLSESGAFKTDLKNFQKISIGNELIKVSQERETKDERSVNAVETKNEGSNRSAAVEIERLENDLKTAKFEIKSLKEANDVFQSQISDLVSKAQSQNDKERVPTEDIKNCQDRLSQMKIRLENMNKIINQK